MLWKRHHSIYSSSAQKQQLILQYEQAKNRHPLNPLTPPAHQSIEPAQNAKFVVRRQLSKHKSNRNLVPGTFFLHRGNNHNIIKTVLQEFGYTENLSKEMCCIIWYQGKDVPKKDFIKKEYNPKATNYLPNHSEITNKQKLYENISKYDPSCVGSFIPKTFIVDFKDNLTNIENNLSQFLVEYFKKAGITKQPKKTNSLCLSNYYGQICIPFVKIFKTIQKQPPSSIPSQQKPTKNSLWIVKPSFLNRGQGIQIISNLRQLQNILNEDSQQISIRMYQPEEKNIPSCFVIQEYIMDPLLYLGYKFDIRAWILLRSSKSAGLEVYIYKKAYTRLACHKYSTNQPKQQQSTTDPEQADKKPTLSRSNENSPHRTKLKSIDTNDRYIHLTNNAVQKNCKEYGTLHEGNQLLVSDLVQKLNVGGLTENYLYDNFRRILKILIQSSKEKLMSKASYGSFQLMGLDFMIDSKLNVWLIQANCNPCLEESSAILKEIIPQMLREMFQVVKIHKLMGVREEAGGQGKQGNWERVL